MSMSMSISMSIPVPKAMHGGECGETLYRISNESYYHTMRLLETRKYEHTC
jgi:hypothetical protein